MFHFTIIEDREIWKSILPKFKNIDCYYSYEYGNLFAKIEEGQLMAAFYEDGCIQLFYPFIKRRVPHIEEEIFDIVTPYGYGGPVLNGSHNMESLKKFQKMFSEYCRLHNIITETVRFHPLNQNHIQYANISHIEYIRKTTAVDLTPSLDEIRNHYSEMNKRNIKKAKQNNLKCYIAEKNEQNIKVFMELYKETMDRNHATNYYYFNNDYFFEQLKDSDTSKTLLLFTKFNKEIIAGVMVLVGKKFAHYHLGASKTKYLGMRPNNLLFDYMIEVSKRQGSEMLNLGGGYHENDGLFKFKTSFTNNNNFDYYIGKVVHNPTKYKAIVEGLKTQYDLNVNYFPMYRGQLGIKKIYS